MELKGTNEDLVYRLLSGQTIFKLDNILYKLMPPTLEILHSASIVYEQTIKSNRFEQWLSDKECVKILAIRGLCSLDIDKNIKEIEKRLDDLKVTLFENYIKPQEFKRVRKELDSVKSLYMKTIGTRHSLDHLTLSGYAEMSRQQYTTLLSLHYLDSNEMVWPNENCVDIRILEKVMSKQQELALSISDIRQVSRTEPWHSYWSSSNGYPFMVPIYQLNNEQRTLVMFTKMYSSIHESPDCPIDDIINDDDLLYLTGIHTLNIA